ncbi:MAG: hypothetical protein II227_05430 [Clostridia bacterium]|nr:hypothetical protein [Clostridia bacterium]
MLIENIRVPVSAADEAVFAEAKRRVCACGFLGAPTQMEMHRKSIDARRKELSFVCSVWACVSCANHVTDEMMQKQGMRFSDSEALELPVGTEAMQGRPVIVGFGPAGIFCGLLLAECGFRPLILERGGCVDERIAAVDSFSRLGDLDVSTNIQFGAGGAGTFSDGKLTTRIGDGRCRYVLERLYELGAPADILWQAKPHIGTDVLRDVIRRADERIRALGGENRYHARAEKITSTSLMVGAERIPFGTLILAGGHSARDLYEELIASGFSVEAKPFSVGVRVEHLQSDIDYAMYGDYAGKYGLVHADYAISHRHGDRGAYSFCMCPGGEVVAAASEEGGVVTNGMSNRGRDGRNANSAIAVSVHTSDYGGTPLGAIAYQRNLEQTAFRAGGKNYAAPCQTVGDFLNGRVGTEAKRIVPTYRSGNVCYTDFHKILPEYVCSMLEMGFRQFGKKIRGFDAADVPMTGVETRTSAPVRILRDDTVLTALRYERIYPCGEGAGYAGGIMSAAVDGIRVAQAILARYKRVGENQ